MAQPVDPHDPGQHRHQRPTVIVPRSVDRRPPPHDLDTEAAVLGASILSRERLEIARSVLKPLHFFADTNQVIFEALCQLADANIPTDLVVLASRLRAMDRITFVGGPAYLGDLVERTPSLVNIREHALIVHRLWRTRSIIARCQITVAEAYDANVDPSLILAEHRVELDAYEAPADRANLRAHIKGLGTEGPPMSLGLAHIDQATRGGLRAQRVLILAGAPGAGKTTLAVQFAHDLALRGVHVAILGCDEPTRATTVRIGQLVGLNRDDLERGDPMACEYLDGFVSGDLARLELIDGEDPTATIETVAAELAARANGDPAMLVIDSLQTVRCHASATADSPRARVDAVCAAIKRVKALHNLFVVATSEVGRAFYRGGKEESPNGMAAGKDSGAIEYLADVQLVLKSVEEGEGDVSVEMMKNRLASSSHKPTWRMRPDYARARMSSIETAPPPNAHDKSAQRQAKEDAAIERCMKLVVEKLVKSRVPIPNVEALRHIVSGKAGIVRAAVQRLLSDGTIRRAPDATRRNGVRLVLSSASDLTLDADSDSADPTPTQLGPGDGEVGATNSDPAQSHPPKGGLEPADSPTGGLVADELGPNSDPTQLGPNSDPTLDLEDGGAS